MSTFTENITTIRRRFDDLEAREQLSILLLGGFLAVVIGYLAVWSPIQQFAVDSQLIHDRNLKLLSHLQSTENEARSAANGSTGATQTPGNSLLTAASSTAQAIGIKPSRLQPEGGAAVSVWFDAVPFTKLMLWLERLESTQGVFVRQISIDDRDETGQVSARLVLRT
ncbi:MAG: general secretion pathway protein M [Candidatus Azotimanducaceae bacterium]|jgi:general secretion pathway protein M